MTQGSNISALNPELTNEKVEKIYHDWDAALARLEELPDGKKLIWEYPRQKSDGEQMDFVESMELNDQGLIQHHAVYWGWRGVNVMLADAYRR